MEVSKFLYTRKYSEYSEHNKHSEHITSTSLHQLDRIMY